MNESDPPHPGESTEPGSGSPRDGGAQKAAGRFAEDLPPRYGETEGERPLGKGGIGEVVVARELRLMREVALKRLRPDRTSTAAEIRLAREARVTGLLEHPGIIPVHDIDRDDQGRLFYTMKQVGGRTLRELIEKLKPVASDATPEEQAERAGIQKQFGAIASRLEIFLKVCDALDFAHSHPLRVIHRDLKPENIMVGDFGEVMVMDWGLAKVLGEGETAESLRGTLVEEEEAFPVNDPTVTLAGQFLGTPAYAPPEQLEGRVGDVDEKSDVYALGGILYHLLSLEAPLTGEEPDPESSLEADGGAPDACDEPLGAIPDRTETAPEPGDKSSPHNTTDLVRKWCLRQIARRATARRLRGRPEEARSAGVPEPLAVVILKALEPDAGNRIGSVKDLAKQVRLYVQGFAGDYERAGAWRHFAYFVRRHQAASLTAAAALALIMTLSLGFTLRIRDQLAETQRQLERSHLEEGRAWFGRAKLAWESEKNPLKALMFAGRAVGFHGYGRRPEQIMGSNHSYQSLLGAKMKDPEIESAREFEETAVREFVESILPTGLPIWSRSVQAHNRRTVTSVSFSPDGSRIASGSDDKTVKLWDAASGEELATLKGHSHSVNSVAFSLDGAQIASGSEDNTVKLWETASGKELITLKGHSHAVNSVAFSPDGALIASGSDDHTVKLWDATTGEELATLKGHTNQVMSVAFSPDGSRIASGSDDRTVKLWHAASRSELATLKGHSGGITSAAFSPDGSRIATGSQDATVKLWVVAQGEEQATLRGHADSISSVAFIPDGTRVASGSWDKSVKIWDANLGKELATLTAHSYAVNSVAFSPDGSRIVSAAGDYTLKVLDTASGKELATLEGHADTVSSVAFSQDGTRIVSGSWDKTVKVWETASGKELATLGGHSRGVTSVAFSPDGSRIASGSLDHTIKLWDAASGKELALLQSHADTVSSVAFSQDGTRIVSGSWDKTVKVWETASGKELATLGGHSRGVTSVAFSPDGSRIASGSLDHTVKLWDAASGKELVAMEGHAGGVNSVTFDRDGSRMISEAKNNNSKSLLEFTIEDIAILHGKSNPVLSLFFSPDGSRVASRSEDNAVRLWDAITGWEIPEVPDFPIDIAVGKVSSPDGTIHAVIDGCRILLVPNSGDLILSAYERAGYFHLNGWELVWNLDSLSSTRTLPAIHFRPDLHARLAEADLTPARRLILRVQLCARGNAWQPLPVLWNEAQAAGLDADPQVRQAFLRYFAIAARALASAETPDFPNKLWSLLAGTLREEDFSDPAFSLAMAQALPLFLRAETPEVPTLRRRLKLGVLPLPHLVRTGSPDREIVASVARQVISTAPLPWLEVVVGQFAERAKNESLELTLRRRDFLRQAAALHPKSATMMRAAIGSYDTITPERIALEDQLLKSDDVIADDFTEVARAAATNDSFDRARTILLQAEARFPGDESVRRKAGWMYLNLSDPSAALRSFSSARAILKPEEKPGTDLLAGLAIAQWLTGARDEAIATYRQLIETGRTLEKPEDWAAPDHLAGLGWTEAETKPLEELRRATLAKHPELQ